jgi:hypothetical protein
MTQMLAAPNKGKLFSYFLAGYQGHDFFSSRSFADNILQGSRAVATVDIQQEILEDIKQFDYRVPSKEYITSFINNFTDWVNIKSLSTYDVDFSNGTTQAFDSFYFRHRNKNFKCFVGEYFYHAKTWISNQVTWNFISENTPLTGGDALVLSVPFCDTGNVQFTDVLNTCEKLNIPVLLDMCYYPLTQGFNIDLDYKCIDTIAFSLSKVFPVALHRIGIRYTKKHIFDGQKLHNYIGYNNLISSHIGQQLIEKHSVDYLFKKYKLKQQEICNYFNIEASQSVIFGIGDHNWHMYNRSNLLKQYQLEFDANMFVNRICLVPILENWTQFVRFKNEH